MRGAGTASISATALRKNIYHIISRVKKDCEPITITSNRGKGAVLVGGEDDWSAIEETLCLMGVPGMAESLIAGKDEPVEECISEDDFEW